MKKIIQITAGGDENPLYCLTENGKVYQYMGATWIEKRDYQDRDFKAYQDKEQNNKK